MGVIIISLPRTGSTSLMNKISNERNLEPIFEPWNRNRKRKEYDPNKKDIVLKTIIDQLPVYVEEVDKINWLIDLVKNFNEIILLSRRNLNDCAESWAYLNYNYTNYLSTEKYYYNPTPNIVWAKEDIVKKHNDLVQLSQSINIPITFYEDIFDLNSDERLRQPSPKNVNPIKKTKQTII